MKVRLLDYARQEHFVDIPDDTEEIVINVITGDMVMVKPIHYDTSDCRMMDFFDATIVLNKGQFHVLDKAKSSYDDILYNPTMEDKPSIGNKEKKELIKSLKKLSKEELIELIKKSLK